MTHDRLHPDHGRGPATALASAWDALRRLPATHPWLWLVRSGPADGFAAKVLETCAYAYGTAPALGLVLLDVLPGFLDAFGSGVCRHG